MYVCHYAAKVINLSFIDVAIEFAFEFNDLKSVITKYKW